MLLFKLQTDRKFYNFCQILPLFGREKFTTLQTSSDACTALKSEGNISILRTGLCLLPKLEVLFFRKTLEFFRLTGGVLTQANTNYTVFQKQHGTLSYL